MRVLIDECLDPGIRDFLTEHQVTTVFEANWQSIADHQLHIFNRSLWSRLCYARPRSDITAVITEYRH